jgi:hypothetical protein
VTAQAEKRETEEQMGFSKTQLKSKTKGPKMKTIYTKAQQYLCILVLGLATASQTVVAKEMSAFDLAKEGNRYIGEQSKDKIVQIRSEKSVGTLTPDLWHVVYYDPDAALKAVEVKFGAGKKMEVKRPVRLLEPITRANEPLLKEKLKIDSDKALDIASKEPVLGKLTLKASRMVLERRGFDDAAPVWKIQLWARLSNPADSVDIGEVVLSAEDGTVLKSDLHPDRVN